MRITLKFPGTINHLILGLKAAICIHKIPVVTKPSVFFVLKSGLRKSPEKS